MRTLREILENPPIVKFDDPIECISYDKWISQIKQAIGAKMPVKEQKVGEYETYSIGFIDGINACVDAQRKALEGME